MVVIVFIFVIGAYFELSKYLILPLDILLYKLRDLVDENGVINTEI